jgi:hypothetical protein
MMNGSLRSQRMKSLKREMRDLVPQEAVITSLTSSNTPDWQTRLFTINFNYTEKYINIGTFAVNNLVIDGEPLNYDTNRSDLESFFKSLYKIQVTGNDSTPTILTLHISYIGPSPRIPYAYEFKLRNKNGSVVSDDEVNNIQKSLKDGWGENKENVVVTTIRSIRVILYYKYKNIEDKIEDKIYTHSRLDYTKEELKKYMEQNDSRCHRTMGISCGDVYGCDYGSYNGSENTSNWLTLCPFMKWRVAGGVCGKYEQLNSTCTTGCSSGSGYINEKCNDPT